MSNWIERQRNILDFTLVSLCRRKRKNLTLISAYTLVVFCLASVLFYTYALKREASLILQGSPEMIVQRLVAGRHDLIPIGYVDKVRKIRGVTSVKERLWGYYYDPVCGANYTLMAQDALPLGAGQIIIGEGVARARLLSQGDPMEFRSHDGAISELVIAQTLHAESELVSSDLILVSQDDFRRLFATPTGYATDLTLTVRNQKELPTIAVKIAELLPDTRQILRDEIIRTYDAVFNWRGGMMMAILMGSLLAFIIFAWDKASGLSQEERREIGILKAIGWDTSDVLLMKFWEGSVVSLSAVLAGFILAYIHIFFGSALLLEPVFKGWAVLYPRFKVRPYIDPSQFIALFFIAVVPYTLATIIPSWRAATVDPDAVMRN